MKPDEYKQRLEYDPSVPAHPWDRYIVHMGMADSIENRVRKYDSDEELCQAIRQKMGLGLVVQDEAARNDFVSQLAMEMFTRWGKQTFQVPDHLQDMFSLTSLSGVTPDVMPDLPYPCIYVDLPDSGWPMEQDGRIHEVSGAFVVDVPDPQAGRVWYVLVWAAELDDAKRFGEDAQFSLGFRFDEWRNTDLDLENYLKRRFEETERFVTPKKTDPDEYMASVVATFRTVLHLVLYLDGEPEIDRDVHGSKRGKLERALARKKNPGSKKARRIRKALDKVPSTKINLVAPSLRPERKINSSAPSNADDSSSPRRRHWVRGHWRKQPYGSREDPDYRMIWIQPHLRGEGDSTAGRTYKIDTTEPDDDA